MRRRSKSLLLALHGAATELSHAPNAIRVKAEESAHSDCTSDLGSWRGRVQAQGCRWVRMAPLCLPRCQSPC